MSCVGLSQARLADAALEGLEDAKSRIGEFLEETYNRQRLHSALAYLTPSEFEQKQELSPLFRPGVVALELLDNG